MLLNFVSELTLFYGQFFFFFFHYATAYSLYIDIWYTISYHTYLSCVYEMILIKSTYNIQYLLYVQDILYNKLL